MKKTIVVINEQHTLLEEQEEILTDQFGRWDFEKVPAEGWSLKQMMEKSRQLAEAFDNIVFVSPLAIMVGETTRLTCTEPGLQARVYCFHNDCREKKELPNGKVISVVAREGWQLILVS